MPSDQLRYLYSLTFILSVTKLVCFNRVRYLVTHLRMIFDGGNSPSMFLMLIMDSAFSEAVVLKLFRTTWIWWVWDHSDQNFWRIFQLSVSAMSGVCAVLPLMTAPPAGGCQHDKYNILSIHCYFKSSSNQCILPIYLYFFQLEEFVLISLFRVCPLIICKKLCVIRIKIGWTLIPNDQCVNRVNFDDAVCKCKNWFRHFTHPAIPSDLLL